MIQLLFAISHYFVDLLPARLGGSLALPVSAHSNSWQRTVPLDWRQRHVAAWRAKLPLSRQRLFFLVSSVGVHARPFAISNLKFEISAPAHANSGSQIVVQTGSHSELRSKVLSPTRPAIRRTLKIAKWPRSLHTAPMRQGYLAGLAWVSVVLAVLFTGSVPLSPLHAASKYTMPDLDQEENTCFPAAASNIIYWFGENGYPKLLPAVVEGESRHRRLFTKLLVHCNVSYRMGTKFDIMTTGLSNFFKEQGYNDVKVSYRGFGGAPFTGPEWFEKNSQDNVGFILCIDYVKKTGDKDYSEAESLGHCISLLTYSDNVAVILDPAHSPDERSRYTFRFQPVRNARLTDSRGSYMLPLVYELPGAPLGFRPAQAAILTGAICIEMPPLATSPGPTQAVGQKP